MFCLRCVTDTEHLLNRAVFKNLFFFAKLFPIAIKSRCHSLNSNGTLQSAMNVVEIFCLHVCNCLNNL